MVEEIVKLKNVTGSVVVAGAIRIRPGETVELKKGRLPEGLRRLVGKELVELQE